LREQGCEQITNAKQVATSTALLLSARDAILQRKCLTTPSAGNSCTQKVADYRQCCIILFASNVSRLVFAFGSVIAISNERRTSFDKRYQLKMRSALWI